MNADNSHDEFSPAKLLKERYLGPANLSIDDAAKKVGLSKRKLEAILGGGEKITIYSARKLAKAFNTTRRFWLRRNQLNDTEYLLSTQANRSALSNSIAQYNAGPLLDMETSLADHLLGDDKITELTLNIMIKQNEWMQTDRLQTPAERMKIIISNFDKAVTVMLSYIKSKYGFDESLSTSLCKRILDAYKLKK